MPLMPVIEKREAMVREDEVNAILQKYGSSPYAIYKILKEDDKRWAEKQAAQGKSDKTPPQK